MNNENNNVTPVVTENTVPVVNPVTEQTSEVKETTILDMPPVVTPIVVEANSSMLDEGPVIKPVTETNNSEVNNNPTVVAIPEIGQTVEEKVELKVVEGTDTSTTGPTVIAIDGIVPEDKKEEPVKTEVPVNNDSNKDTEYVNEKLKKVEVNYTPPSNFKMFMTILMFIFFVVFIIFLPDISSYIRLYKAGKLNQPVEEITTGSLMCTLESNTATLDKNYSRSFKFEDNKLKSATFETVTKGDISADDEVLNEINSKCIAIKDGTQNLQGIQVSCEFKSGVVTEKEIFDYNAYDIEEIRPAYTEAGTDVLEFELDEDIDTIMKNMRQAGFTCNKTN